MKTVNIIHNFLHSGQPKSSSETAVESSATYEPEKFHESRSVRLDFTKSYSDIHEIIVPTCSYRMGVDNMGYGAMELCKYFGKMLYGYSHIHEF